MTTVLVTAAVVGGLAGPALRLVWRLAWLCFCGRMLRQPGGLETLRQAAPYLLAGAFDDGAWPARAKVRRRRRRTSGPRRTPMMPNAGPSGVQHHRSDQWR